MDDVKILGLCGSLRRDSHNRRLLLAAGRTLTPIASMSVFDHLKEIPPFDEDDESSPPATVVRLRAQIADADALLIATPEYNGSLPGQLKNALDWASRPYETNVLRDKPVAVIGASPSPGATRHANADAHRILARSGARPIDATLMVARAVAQLDSSGLPIDLDQREQLARVLTSLAAVARAATSGGTGTGGRRASTRLQSDHQLAGRPTYVRDRAHQHV